MWTWIMLLTKSPTSTKIERLGKLRDRSWKERWEGYDSELEELEELKHVCLFWWEVAMRQMELKKASTRMLESTGEYLCRTWKPPTPVINNLADSSLS
jgi:hypothetical protein